MKIIKRLTKLSYRLTKTRQPTSQQIAEYITESNWMAILKCHMDAIDEIKTFKDHDTANIEIFTTFI